MITFTSDSKKNLVRCGVNCGLRIPASIFQFTWRCTSDHEAILLARHFKDRFLKAVRNAREQAYDQGFADGRGKKRRKTGFSNSLDADCPGVW